MIHFELVERAPFAQGRAFGTVGPFERIDGVVHFDVDPDDPANAGIVDLALAPRNPDGHVSFRSALTAVTPLDAPPGARRVIVDVPNRGRCLTPVQLNRATRDLDAPMALDPGDGFVFDHGFSVASLGWQWDVDPALGLWHAAPRLPDDVEGQVVCRMRPSRRVTSMHFGQLGEVPYPPADPGDPRARLIETDGNVVTELGRNTWQFARSTADGFEPSSSHVHHAPGFKPGATYELVYYARSPAVAGTGLLAVRDFACWLREPDNPLGVTFEHVLGFGVSQTGRFLRQFLYEGLNDRGATRPPAFDGMLIHIAGGQRGDFNHRFAQPSAAGAPSYGQRFPFAATHTTDPHGATVDGLMPEGAATPKVLFTNTSWEYWRGDASLIHIDGVRREDLPEPDNTRTYLFAGAQHISGWLPPTRSYPLLGIAAHNPFSVVDYIPLLRAALVNLHAWVSRGAAPPASAVPRIDDGTARTRDEVLEQFAGRPDLGALDPERLPRLRTLDLGPDADSQQPRYPAIEGDEYPACVAVVDADLNETAGIRLPDLTAPVGCHTGWNPRDARTGAPEQPVIFFGSTAFFSPDEVRNRYPDRAAYLTLVRTAAEALVHRRLLLSADLDLVVDNCAARYDAAVAGAGRETRG